MKNENLVHGIAAYAVQQNLLGADNETMFLNNHLDWYVKHGSTVDILGREKFENNARMHVCSYQDADLHECDVVHCGMIQ